MARPSPVSIAALLSLGCGGEAPPVAPPLPPMLAQARAEPNPHNALSATVALTTDRADSVAVRFQAVDPLESPEQTPSAPATPGQVTIPVLGLEPDRQYRLTPIAYGAGGTTVGEPLELVTGSLPADLPTYVAGGSAPSPGYVVFAAGRYGMVIDNTGRVVWYRVFPNGPGLNFQALPTGRYAARPPPASATDPAPWVELDPLGNQTRTLSCARGLQPRFHDLIAEQDGSYWLMCDETRVLDLTSVGGVAAARVTGTVIQHVAPGGDLLFEWSPFDHFLITDLPLADRSGPTVNWTHGNAIDHDSDGNVVVSFRSLSELTAIDPHTGEVIWRMGGLRNQFAFEGTGLPAFRGQHGLRLGVRGELLLLDNLGEAEGSRAERYWYDATQRRARLLSAFGSDPGVTANLGGTTQDLPGGRVLVAYGNAGRVEEYDGEGVVVWRILGSPGYIFRAQRIRSLYQPGLDGRP